MTVRVRLQFDEGSIYAELPDMPRIGESIMPPEPYPALPFRVSDICHYARDHKKVGTQCADVRVLGTFEKGPREPEGDERL